MVDEGGEVEMSDKIVKCLSCNEQISEWDRIFSTDDGYYHDDCVEVVAKTWLIFDKLDMSICNEVEECEGGFASLSLEEDQYLKED